MSDWNRIAHPEWIDDAVESLHRSLGVDIQLHGMPQRAFMLSTPAHRLLRSIYGGYWSVAWWAIRRAVAVAINGALPHWWHKWRYRRLYGEDPDEVLAEFEPEFLDDEDDDQDQVPPRESAAGR